MPENEPGSLSHAGVKGMKWGVRKSDSSSSSGSSNKRKGGSPQAEQAKRIAKKKPSQMTNREIKKLNERKRLETEYKKNNPNLATKGKAQVASLIALGGMGISIYNMVNSKAGKAAVGLAKASMAASSVGSTDYSTLIPDMDKYR